MKNKNLIIVLAVGVIALVVVGFLFFSKKAPVPVVQAPAEEVVSTMKPEDIGLTLTASTDNHKVILAVANTNGIAGLDYELSYTSQGDIPRGVIGHIDIKVAGKPVTQEITLGTCSDVCHYDMGVSNIQLILKVAKTDGTTSQVQKSLTLIQ